FWSDVRLSGATVTNLLGSMTNFLWSQPNLPDDSENPLRLVSLAPTPKYALEFESRFALRAMNNYGLSDFGMATAFTARDPDEKKGSIGRRRPGVQIRVVDDEDFALATGEIGEMILRTDEPWRSANGYYGMPEATLAANRNG
ncbi:MAG: AMP-binding protein, partial [Pseudomonadota bacterium]|nr:AMP-binding protein [Pseudomonadota bacterium]